MALHSLDKGVRKGYGADMIRVAVSDIDGALEFQLEACRFAYVQHSATPSILYPNATKHAQCLFARDAILREIAKNLDRTIKEYLNDNDN